MNSVLRRLLPAILSLASVATPADANQAHGTEFWAVHRTVYGPDFGVAVVNPSLTAGATVTVSDHGVVLDSTVLAPGASHVFRLGWRMIPLGALPIMRTEIQASVRITSDAPIAAYQADTWDASAGSDASLLVPRSELGSDYLMTSWVGAGDGEGYGLLHVVAVGPGDTHYSVTRRDGSVVDAGTLHEWESRLIPAWSVLDARDPDPNGWRITTDRPAAVFGGNNTTYVGTSTCCADAMEEQLWPVSALGTRFALSPLRAFPATPGPRTADAFFVIAAQDGTSVTTTPPVGSALLSSGERLEIVSSEPFVLEASAPVQVAKFQASWGATDILGVPTTAPRDGDPALVLVPDVRAFAREASFLPVSGMLHHVLSIVSETGGSLELDGAPIAVPCEPVGTIDARDWCHVVLPITEATHHLASTRPFWAEVSSNIEQGSFAVAVVQGRVLAAPPAALDLDVKPGSCPNPVNFGRRGVIPAALAAIEADAAADVDLATVRMEGVPALRCTLDDVTAPWAETADACCDTPGPDGLTDLVCHFDSAAVAAALCARPVPPVAGDVIDIHVTARTRTGSDVDVFDCIRVQQHDCGFTGPRFPPPTRPNRPPRMPR